MVDLFTCLIIMLFYRNKASPFLTGKKKVIYLFLKRHEEENLLCFFHHRNTFHKNSHGSTSVKYCWSFCCCCFNENICGFLLLLFVYFVVFDFDLVIPMYLLALLLFVVSQCSASGLYLYIFICT